MYKILKVTLHLIIVYLFVNISAENNENIASVSIKPKQFNGFVQSVGDKKVNVFLGIPYAKPPICELRFKKPIAYEYDKPIDAYKWPNPCSQIKLDSDSTLVPLIGNKNFSEDCLYLNIWSPVVNQKKAILKPVLFWIHGGGLSVGASNIENTEAEVLATRGDVVVVTINYRLQLLGFLYTGSDEAPGNMGLWDQAMALKWVNEHISYFGGDPNQITIIGESAGSWSVSLHLLSPITKNLFKNSVMMSGSALADFYDDKDSVKNIWTEVANHYGCKEDFDIGCAECFRNINVNNLTDSEFGITLSNKAIVIYGDEFLPQKPGEMLRSGNYKKNVNLLMGTTDDEGSIMLKMIDSKRFSDINSANITKSEAIEFLKTILPLIYTKADINAEEVSKLYLSQLPEDNYDLIRRSIGIVLGDYYLLCPTIEFGKLLFSGDRNRTKVYQYLWSAKYVNSWHGAEHGSEIEYFSPFRENNDLKPESDPNLENKKKISDKLIHTLSHFARNGKPPPQEGIEWNSYYIINKRIITPYYEFNNNIKTYGNFGYGFKYECDKFWKKYLNNK